MPEIDTTPAADSSSPTPPDARSAFTPRTLLLLGVLCSIVGLGFVTALIDVLSHPPRLPLSSPAVDAVWMGALSLTCLTGAALFFVRARAGYRRGYVLPLTFREQLAAACATTLFLAPLAVDAVQSREWLRLMVVLFNPMLIRTWFGVFAKMPAAKTSFAPTGAGSVTVAEKPADGRWWTHYDTRHQNDVNRTDDRLTNGRR